MSTARGRNAAVTAVGQAFVLLGATAIGLIVAARLGAGARVDAYFAANQVFAAALYVGQGIRTSVPGLEVGGVASRRVVVRAVGLLALGATGAMAVAAFLGQLVLPSDVGADFTRDLLVLAPGAALQVAGGYFAARLAITQRFLGASLAYAAATLCNAALLLARIDAEGAAVLAPAALLGSVVAAALLAAMCVRAGALGSAAEPDAAEGATTAGTLLRILLAVAPVLAAQASITVAVVAAASAVTGGSALMAYAYLATNAIATLAVAPISIVLSSDLGETWDRRPASLSPLVVSIAALSAAIVAPAALAGILIGGPIARAFLPALSPGEVDTILTVLAIQVPSLPFSATAMVALVAVITLDRLPRLALLLALLLLPFGGAVVAIVAAGGGLVALGIATSVSAIAVAIVTLQVAVGGEVGRVALAAARRSLELLVACGAVAALATLAWPDPVPIGTVALVAAGLLAHVAWLAWRAPAELRALTAVIRPG